MRMQSRNEKKQLGATRNEKYFISIWFWMESFPMLNANYLFFEGAEVGGETKKVKINIYIYISKNQSDTTQRNVKNGMYTRVEKN